MVVEEEDYSQIKEWLDYYSSTENKVIKKYLQNLIVMASEGLVKRISIGMTKKTGYVHDDFIQVGFVGLMKAIDFYKPTISTKFKTYATYFIVGEIKHYIRDKATIIKPPRKIQELSSKINATIKSLIEKGEEPSLENLSLFLGVSIEDIVEVIEIHKIKNTLSLDQSFNAEDEAFSLGEKIPACDYQEFLEAYEEKIMLLDAIKKLDPELTEIIKLSYYDDLNQREIAERLGISQMQVSRRLKKALKGLYNVVVRDYAEIKR